jgi:hypothetical protein
MKRILVVSGLALGMVLILCAGFSMAQTGGEPDHISRWTIGASTGGVMTSTSFAVAGTMAQVSVDLGIADRRYSIGGIWPPHDIEPWYTSEIPTPGPPVVPTVVLPTQLPPTPQPTPQAGDVEPFDLLRTTEGGDYFPETLNLPGCPDLEPPDFPATLNLPDWPDLTSPEFTTTLSLPDMPTLTITSAITNVFSPVISMTEALVGWDTVITTGLFMSEEMAGTMGLDVSGFEDGSGDPTSDLDTYEIAGYTSAEMTSEIITGAELVLSYLRSVNEIGVLGPTAAALLVAFAYVMLFQIVSVVFRFVVFPIWIVRRVWELLPFT